MTPAGRGAPVEGSSDPLEGGSLGRYRLVQRLAQGGMATVYLARQEGPGGFGRPVAIKVVHAHLAREPRFKTMFLDEARLTGRIQHPNVCSVVDFGEERGRLYLVMEYLHGETLGAVIRRGWRGGSLSPAIVARIVADAARALHAAHELRDDDGTSLEIVHRDVSPQNLVVLYDGHTKLTDFGIARARGRLTDTSTGELKGKISFMSPEQLQSGLVDRRTDVWALGVVAWEALTGKRLFRAENEGATALNVVSAPIAAPSSVAEGVPAALDRIVLRALDRDLGARIPTAAELADALEEYLYARGRPLGATEVAAWMDTHFEDRIRDRAASLKGRASSVPLDLPITGSDSLQEVKTAIGTPGGLEESLVRPTATRAGRPGARGAIVGGVGLVAAIAIGVTLAWVLPRDESADTALETAAATVAEAGTAAGPAIAAAPEIAAAPATASTPETAATPGTAGTPGPEAEAVSPVAEPVTVAGTQAAVTPLRREARTAPARPPGTINLLAIPQAEVFLRGRSIGRTPLVGRELPAGTHVLELREVGGSRRERVRVEIRSAERTNQSVRFGG